MKEHPILFSGEMVRAILDGRKTQTRRVITPQPDDDGEDGLDLTCLWYAPIIIVKDMEELGPEVFGFSSLETGWKCPYGAPGDRLWVRESFRELIDLGHGTNSSHNYYEYKADQEPNSIDFNPDVKWKPSIFMPREASRITLEIVSVRVERVQDITSDDVLAEGIKKTEVDEYWLAPLAGVPDYPWGHAQQAYAALWSSINDKRGYGWNVNPWVWVIEFKKVEQ